MKLLVSAFFVLVFSLSAEAKFYKNRTGTVYVLSKSQLKAGDEVRLKLKTQWYDQDKNYTKDGIDLISGRTVLKTSFTHIVTEFLPIRSIPELSEDAEYFNSAFHYAAALDLRNTMGDNYNRDSQEPEIESLAIRSSTIAGDGIKKCLATGYCEAIRLKTEETEKSIHDTYLISIE